MNFWGMTSLLLGSPPSVLKVASLPLTIAQTNTLGPPIPWKLETFPFLLFIFIIHSHF